MNSTAYADAQGTGDVEENIVVSQETDVTQWNTAAKYQGNIHRRKERCPRKNRVITRRRAAGEQKLSIEFSSSDNDEDFLTTPTGKQTDNDALDVMMTTIAQRRPLLVQLDCPTSVWTENYTEMDLQKQEHHEFWAKRVN